MELGYDDAGRTRGIELAIPLAWDPAMLDVAAAVTHVADTGPVAVIGFCFGGSIAWLSACDLPIAAAVGYYGGQIHGMIDRRPQAPIALHFGELDHGIPLEHVEAIAAAHPDVPVYVYPAPSTASAATPATPTTPGRPRSRSAAPSTSSPTTASRRKPGP